MFLVPPESKVRPMVTVRWSNLPEALGMKTKVSVALVKHGCCGQDDGVPECTRDADGGEHVGLEDVPWVGQDDAELEGAGGGIERIADVVDAAGELEVRDRRGCGSRPRGQA